jgi:hypothetical protein
MDESFVPKIPHIQSIIYFVFHAFHVHLLAPKVTGDCKWLGRVLRQYCIVDVIYWHDCQCRAWLFSWLYIFFRTCLCWWPCFDCILPSTRRMLELLHISFKIFLCCSMPRSLTVLSLLTDQKGNLCYCYKTLPIEPTALTWIIRTLNVKKSSCMLFDAPFTR